MFEAKLAVEQRRLAEDIERKYKHEFDCREYQRNELLQRKMAEIEAEEMEKNARYQRMAQAGQMHFGENMRLSRELSEIKLGHGKLKPSDRTIESDSFLVSRNRTSRTVVDVRDMMLKKGTVTGHHNVVSGDDEEQEQFHDSASAESSDEAEEVYTDFVAPTSTSSRPFNEVHVEIPYLNKTGPEHTICCTSKNKRTRNRVPTKTRYNIMRSMKDKDITFSKNSREHAHSDQSEAAATDTTLNETAFIQEDGSLSL